MFKNEEGFSLLELVVAVGVAGIIAAVALPTFAGLQDKATTTSATYAASASAAEALANSTIGGVNGSTSSNGAASSNTGGSSSSSSVSGQAYLLPPTNAWSFTGGMALVASASVYAEIQANPQNYKLVIEGGSMSGSWNLQAMGGAFNNELKTVTMSLQEPGFAWSMYPDYVINLNFMGQPGPNGWANGQGWYSPGSDAGVVSIQHI